MRINKPLFSLKDFYNDCISHYRDKDKHEIMNSILPELEKDESRYKCSLKSKTLHLEKNNQLHGVDKTDLINLYERKLLNPKLRARTYYDRIKTAADICPYCGKRHTKTVDHFLSKSNYPNFSITPINLVPCCSDCNTSKKDKDADINDISNLLFHPYEESLAEFKWLKAKIEIIDDKIHFIYYVSKDTIDDITYMRLKNQFTMLELDKFYEVEANVEFARSIEAYRELYYEPDGEKLLMDHFKFELRKYSKFDFKVNYYMYVYYESLIENFDKLTLIF